VTEIATTTGVTEIVDAALERGYLLAFRERAGGWEAAWRPTAA
jgi:hypothetical protein